MTEVEYEAKVTEYESKLVEFEAKVDKLELAERALVAQSHEDEALWRSWVARYDVALEGGDKDGVAAYRAAVEALREKHIARTAALNAVRAEYEALELERPRRSWGHLLGLKPMSWFKKTRRLHTHPTMIAESLHRIMADKDDSQAAPETFHLPDAVHALFREKVFLYLEANILLALVNRVKPSRDGTSHDSLLEPVLPEYERIIFTESPETPAGTARLASVRAAMGDLSARMNPNDSAIAHVIEENRRMAWAFTWGRNWFADIGHDETNPATLTQFFLFW